MIKLDNLLALIVMAFCIAVTGFTYSYILTKPGEIFAGWYKFLDGVFKNDNRYSQGKDMHPLFKPLIGCEKCVSGQMALIIFSLYYSNIYWTDPVLYISSHIFIIGLSIFFATIIKSFYTKNIE